MKIECKITELPITAQSTISEMLFNEYYIIVKNQYTIDMTNIVDEDLSSSLEVYIVPNDKLYLIFETDDETGFTDNDFPVKLSFIVSDLEQFSKPQVLDALTKEYFDKIIEGVKYE